MSKREVLGVLGPPDAVRIESNAVVCLTYSLHERAVWSRVFGKRVHVVALKENRLVSYETVRAEAIRFYCSRIAGRWDPSICYLRLAGAGLCALTSDSHLHASFMAKGH